MLVLVVCGELAAHLTARALSIADLKNNFVNVRLYQLDKIISYYCQP